MFAGIGGFRSGLTNVGDFFMPTGFCEIDPYVKKAYESIYEPKGELFFEDARTINPEALPDFDLICGGFPCQSFSIAGKRGGFEDARGTLFFEIAQIAAVKRPAYLLLENVPGLLSHDEGRTFATILGTLDELGYNVAYMNHKLLTKGHTAAAIDELYLFLTNPTAIEYIRNAMKRVRKKESSIILSSQNIEDFLLPKVKEMTKPMFSIPTHQFLFHPGNINPKEYIDALQLEVSEFDLIKYPERGTCLFKCGNERYLLQVKAPDHKAKLFGNAGGR